MVPPPPGTIIPITSVTIGLIFSLMSKIGKHFPGEGLSTKVAVIPAGSSSSESVWALARKG
jgi:hypothetical protein